MTLLSTWTAGVVAPKITTTCRSAPDRSYGGEGFQTGSNWTESCPAPSFRRWNKDGPDSEMEDPDSSASLPMAKDSPVTGSLPMAKDSPVTGSLPMAKDSPVTASLVVAKDSPVTASLGPVGPLLRQLRSPTTQPEVVTKDEIHSLTKELNGLCISLMHHSEAEEPSSTAKCWMSEVRELCYDTKNYFDDAQFISKEDHDALLTLEEKQENARFEFEILVARAEHAKERRDRYGIDQEGIKKPKLPSIGFGRRLPVLFPELIDDGRMYQRMLDNLLRTSTEEKQLKVISLVGLEGVGKTTLAKRLYHHQQIGERFPCRAFVRVSPNPDMIKILTSIFTQIKGHQPDCYLDAQDLITNIRTHLQDKRYLIIIDDLWSTSVWDIIMRAFPDDGCHSSIITTTQLEDVATACCSYQRKYIYMKKTLDDDQSRKLFFSMVFCFEDKVSFPDDFNGVLSDIIMKCGGLPLSIVNIASLLPTPSEPNPQQWMGDIRDSLPSTLRTNPTSLGIKEVINLIYNNLSPQLKTCLLYLVVYPEGYTVNKDDLVKQWVIEGFIGDGERKYEIAGGYFDELVSRGMIQAVDINYNQVLSCTLHHTVYDLIVKKSIEENFIITVDNFQSSIGLPHKVRRLSVQFGGARSACVPTGIMVSEVRSLAFFGFYGCADIIEECKLLRVLILHVWADPVKVTDVLSGISKLIALRYLKIACNVEIELATKIQDLQLLETLEVDMPLVAIPSEIGGLRRLSSLKIVVGKLSNEDISILQALPVLAVLALNVRTTPVEMIIFKNWGFLVLKYFEFRCPVPWLKFEAGSMTALRNLDLCFNAHEADQEDRTETINVEHLPGLKEITAHIWGANNFRTTFFDNHPSNPRIEVLVDRIFNGDPTSTGKRAKKYVSNDEGKREDEKKQATNSRLKRMSTLKGVPKLKGASSLVPMEGLKRAHRSTPGASSGIAHRAHPKHKLTLEPTGLAKFKCNGCHELGTGADRYTCRPCDFDLHKDCALAQPTFEHKVVPGSTFGLCFEAPRTKHKQMCSACGGYVQGLHYHSNYLYLHPCCAKLPLEIQLGDHLTFELRAQVSHCCTKCRKGGGVRDVWFYRSTCKTVYLHVPCVIEDFLRPSSSSSTDGNSELACYVTETTLQKHRSGKSERNLDPIFEIVKALASIITVVLTGNPVPVITASVDLGSSVIKSLKTR